MDNIQEYTEEIQEMFLKFLVSDPELFVRVNNIVEPYMFNKKYQDTVKFLKLSKFNSLINLTSTNSPTILKNIPSKIR